VGGWLGKEVGVAVAGLWVSTRFKRKSFRWWACWGSSPGRFRQQPPRLQYLLFGISRGATNILSPNSHFLSLSHTHTHPRAHTVSLSLQDPRPIPEADLPLTLPDTDDFKPSGTPDPPLAKIAEWVAASDPVTGGPARRETSTMPQWAGSCWYYLRYIDPGNTQR
jgi:hypothetical protein